MKLTEVFSDYMEGKTPKDITLDVVAFAGLALFVKTAYETVSHRESQKDEKEEEI